MDYDYESFPSLVAFQSDTVPSDSLHLDIAKSVAGFVRTGAVCAFFYVTRTISRKMCTGTFSASWEGGATRCLRVAVVLTFKTTPDLSVQQYFD
jgi:hypothetical protein